MTHRRADALTYSLLNQTVLNKWFEPMANALKNVHFSDNVFTSLPMKSFILFGGLRQLLSISTLREQIQNLFNFDPDASQMPLARSTWSDALASKQRNQILRQAVDILVKKARTELADKFEKLEGIGERPIIAFDTTYLKESSHYRPLFSQDGGDDNAKGHAVLVSYDLRHGIPVGLKTETASLAEIRMHKDDYQQAIDWSQLSNAIYVVDRGFIQGRYWDSRKKLFNATMITRFKSTLSYSESSERQITANPCNESVVSDHEIKLVSADNALWRLIIWRSPEGLLMKYLTNDLSLEPGVIAFLYYRRWDEEKYFDNFKNDLANTKAWGKSPVAIEQQCLMGMMTYILTRLFLKNCCEELELSIEDDTQRQKQAQKQEHYLATKEALSGSETCLPAVNEEGEENVTKCFDAYRAFYAIPSKISRQIWRFLKNCCAQKSTIKLYEARLKPVLLGYL